MKRRASIARPDYAWCCALCERPDGLYEGGPGLALTLRVSPGRRRKVCLRCAWAIFRRLEKPSADAHRLQPLVRARLLPARARRS